MGNLRSARNIAPKCKKHCTFKYKVGIVTGCSESIQESLQSIANQQAIKLYARLVTDINQLLVYRLSDLAHRTISR